MQSNTKKQARPSPQEDVPHVLIDGVPFCSDRFYLNVPTGVDNYKEIIQTSEFGSSSFSRNEQQQQSRQQPHFDRARLVQGLDLVAAVIGTYTFDPEWLSRELPTLFPPLDARSSVTECAIPTLLLHGQKGWKNLNPSKCNEDLDLPSSDKNDGSKTSIYSNEKKMPGIDRNIPIPNNEPLQNFNSCVPPDREIIEIDDDSDSDSSNTRRPLSSSSKSIMSKKRKRKRQETKGNHFGLNLNSIHKLAAKHGKKLYQAPESTSFHNHFDTDDEKDNDHSFVSQLNSSTSVKCEDDGYIPPEEAWMKIESDLAEGRNEGSSQIRLFGGDTIHMTQVLPTWFPTEMSRDWTKHRSRNSSKNPERNLTRQKSKASSEVIVIDSSSDDEFNRSDETEKKPECFGVDPELAKNRKWCAGVHHPKFMMLFERSGSVVVVISTANFTKPCSIDASWVQRFHPIEEGCEHNETLADLKAIRESCDGSDFGFVLFDFLQRQSDSADMNQLLPLHFFKRYLGGGNVIDSLDDVRRRFKFEDASVHLVATVPGVYPSRSHATHLSYLANNGGCLSKRRILYGPQRVQDILARLSEREENEGGESCCKPWLPHNVLSASDRLVMQQTSLGGKWDASSMGNLVKMYSGTSDSSCEDALDLADIVWPSKDFMDDLNKHDKHFAFLSTKIFNDIDLACCSRMCVYEPQRPSPTPFILSPHIKLYCRVIDELDLDTSDESREHLGWIMLTSACLSRGAQGHMRLKNTLEEGTMSYSNFELGVLFCSRLQGDPEKDRIYCCNTNHIYNEKTSNSGANHVRIIDLPVPFNVNPKSYQVDPDDATFHLNPFFHEITPGTENVGQMTLTPFGKEFVKENAKENNGFRCSQSEVKETKSFKNELIPTLTNVLKHQFKSFMIMLVGLPGSGKSTFARRLASGMPTAFTRINQDELGSRQKCELKCREAINENKIPIIDRCNFDDLQRKHFLDIAVECGNIQIHCVIFRYSREVCIERCRKRVQHETIKKGQEAAVVTRLANFFSPPESTMFQVVKTITSFEESENVAVHYLNQFSM